MFIMNPMNAMQGMGGVGQGDLMLQLMKTIMAGSMGGPQMPMNFNFGADGTRFSDGAFERGGYGSIPSFGNQQAPMGYNQGAGMVPGFGGMGGGFGAQCPQQMMQQMMMMMMMMMQMMQQMGAGQQNPYGQQSPYGQQNPYGQQQPYGQQPIQPFGQRPPHGQGGGQTIELQKGQSFTTPGGSTIDWKGNTVKVKEPGGQQRDLGGGSAAASASAGFGGAAASAAASGAGSAAAAATAGGGGAAASAAVDGATKNSTKAKEWKVWGDPHIQNPDGSKQDFKTKNAVFSLQDGTKVMMCADNPKGVVEKVRVTLPGGQLNMQGVDAKQTTVYGNGDGNKFVNQGTLDQYMNGFPNAGFGQSPYGNQMFQ